MTRSADISPLSVLLTRIDAVSDGSPSPSTIACGFPSIDKMLGGGLRRGDLAILGGDAASGKSALALAFAIRASLANTKAAVLTGEMSVERVLERILAIESRARIDDLRQGTLDDLTRANAGAAALRLRDHLPVVDLVEPGDNLKEAWPDADLVVVDSIASFAAPDRARDEGLAAVIKDLKSMAIERDAAVLATAPLPRLAERPDMRPDLDDFGALGAIKEMADVVLGIYRQDMYEPSRDIQGATELIILKNRNGPIGYVDLYFYAQWMRFEDMLDPDR